MSSTFSIESINVGGLNLDLTSDSSEVMPKVAVSTGKGWGYWLFWGLVLAIVLYLSYIAGKRAYKWYNTKNVQQSQDETNMPPIIYDDTEESAMNKPVPGSKYATFEENPY